MIEKMKALAKQRDMCVLATVADGIPHRSLMAYVTDEDCREIYKPFLMTPLWVLCV